MYMYVYDLHGSHAGAPYMLAKLAICYCTLHFGYVKVAKVVKVARFVTTT